MSSKNATSCCRTTNDRPRRIFCAQINRKKRDGALFYGIPQLHHQPAPIYHIICVRAPSVCDHHICGAEANAANKILVILCNNYLHFRAALRTRARRLGAAKWSIAILCLMQKGRRSESQRRPRRMATKQTEAKKNNIHICETAHKTQFLILILLHFFKRRARAQTLLGWSILWMKDFCAMDI